MVNNLTTGRIEQQVAISSPLIAVRNVELLGAFVDLLTKWNRKINLTSLDLDPLADEAIDRLIVEPVVASQFMETADVRIIDLGSGGGSPAIPFHSQLPGSSLRMVESRSRKCAFLREAIRTLELQRSAVDESRFELIQMRTDLHAVADVITVRAVRFDDQFLELLRFLLVPGGLIYRFASGIESHPTSGLQLVASHHLVASRLSDLQILRLA